MIFSCVYVSRGTPVTLSMTLVPSSLSSYSPTVNSLRRRVSIR